MKSIEEFCMRDNISRMCPGYKDYVTNKKRRRKSTQAKETISV